MCSILTVLPSQLQHSCLNSTPALPLFPCRGVFGGGGGALCFYKLVVPLGFASLARYHLLLSDPMNNECCRLLALLCPIFPDEDKEIAERKQIQCLVSEVWPAPSWCTVKFSRAQIAM